MARVIEKKNELAKNRNRTIGLYWGGHIFALGFGILAVELLFSDLPIIAAGVMWVLSIAGAITIHMTRDKVGILSAGVKGEKKALEFLKRDLPDRFCCITNAQIYYEKRHNELDLIAVGPTGVFIIEVKNVSGKISGAYSGNVWTQEKGKNTKDMRNPIQQVRTHVDILQRYLKAKGHRIWVRGAVLMVNPKAHAYISGIPHDGIPVFSVSDGGREKLVQYLIDTFPSVLSEKEIEEVASII